MATIQTRVSIWDTAGYEADRIVDDYIAEAYDQSFKQNLTVTGSTSTFEVELGPISTVEFLYIATTQPITVYRNNSLESWNVGDVLLVIGCSITALHILAENDCTITIYAAGT